MLASYLFNDFRFQQNAALKGNRIAGVPDQVLSAELVIKLPHGIEAGPTLRAASRAFVDHANTTTAPGYSLYGVKVNQRLSNGLSWFVEGRNLGDKRFANTTGVVLDATVPSFGAIGRDQALFSPGDGRSIYAGISKAF